MTVEHGPALGANQGWICLWCAMAIRTIGVPHQLGLERHVAAFHIPQWRRRRKLLCLYAT